MLCAFPKHRHSVPSTNQSSQRRC